MIEEISNCKELLETDKSRFDGRLNLPGGELHQDINKHILAFDIIYCFSSYNLYGGIDYTKRNMKEKKLYLEMVAKKDKALEIYNKAKDDDDRLEDAFNYLLESIKVGDSVIHKKYGTGIVKHINKQRLVVDF